MYLVQLLLPEFDNEGQRYGPELFGQVRTVLTEKFEGLTVYSRSPAEGIWAAQEGRAVRDVVILFEVMAQTLDHEWWSRFRQHLERQFRQDWVVCRAYEITTL